MKRSDLSKAIGAGIIAAGLALAPAHLPASAQTDTTGGTTGGTNTTTTTQLLVPMSQVLMPIGILIGDGWDCLACRVCSV
jgi:hypothetical protein